MAVTAESLANEGDTPPIQGPQLVVGRLTNVGSSWQKVSLPYFYDQMIVVASPVYTAAALPAVVRIKKIEDKSFEIRVQNPSGKSLSGYTVQYMVLEAGVYNAAEHGITMEAVSFKSTVTDHASSWKGQSVAYQNTYSNPVVVGQVMTFNDDKWSVFWSHGDTADAAPGPGSLFVGKHVGEDSHHDRKDETLGYVVFESGEGILDGYAYEAIEGSDIVRGMDDEPPYTYSHGLSGNGFAIVSQAAMDGTNGSWSVLWGDDALTAGSVLLAVDEDQLEDAERVHSSEQVHAVIFSEMLLPPEIFSFSPQEGERGTIVEITGQHFVEVEDVSFGGWSSKSYEVVSDTRILAAVPQEAGTGRIRVRNSAGLATTSDVFRIIAATAVVGIVPDRAEASSTVKIEGLGFLSAQSVEFSGGAEADFTIVSDEEIQATVPANSLSGPVTVIFENGDILQGPFDFVLTFSDPLQGMNLCRLTGAVMEQSSTNAPFARAGKACDGVTAGSLEGESFTDTSSEAEPWWEVDLGGIYNISEVAVWNRVDCCQADLSGFYVFVSDGPFSSQSLIDVLIDGAVDPYFIDEVATFESVDVDRTGRYVRVQKQGTGALVLAEVEIVSGAGNIKTELETEDPSESVVLEQAFPSPFRSFSTIKYHMEKTGPVHLGVFDVLGREVRVLQNGEMQAGVHQANFHADELPAGVYFIRLVAGGKVLTGSVILAR